jgi:ribonuclease D
MTFNHSENRPRQNLISFPGKIHVISCDRDLLALDLSAVKEFGFDTETKPSFRKGDVFKAALLQLSTETDAYLIRLHHVTQWQVLKRILENPEVVKVGVAIRDDIKALQKIFSFMPGGVVELQDLAKQKGLKNFGLKGMADEVLQAMLSKQFKMTNWEARELSEQQELYAATDAWVGLIIYRKLMGRVASEL